MGSKPCPYMQYCTKLWCTGKAKGQMVCQTRHFPWADGTGCGEGKFCLKGTCVERHNLDKYRVSAGAPCRGPWGLPCPGVPWGKLPIGLVVTVVVLHCASFLSLVLSPCCVSKWRELR